MRTSLALVLGLTIGTAFGCATANPQTPELARARVDEEHDVSLFPSDAAVLTDEAVAKILDTTVRLPEKARVALLHVEHGSVVRHWGWGPYWAAMGPAEQQQVTDSVAATLASSPRIRSTGTLPRFLLPEKPTVGHLREAAARTQVDLVLIYRTDCQAYQRSRLFGATQAKAFCSAESALLDVRSGVVPFTTRALRDFTVDQKSGDAGFLETVRKAETAAFTAALDDCALALVKFLGTAP